MSDGIFGIDFNDLFVSADRFVEVASFEVYIPQMIIGVQKIIALVQSHIKGPL